MFAKRLSPLPTPDTIVIHMSVVEARTLKQICQHVGGDPNASPRKHTDALNRALSDAGVYNAQHTIMGRCEIFFDDTTNKETL